MRSSRPIPARHLDDVGAGLLADVGDLVDERDLGREKRVRGELDHLGAGDVGAHERRLERRVELDDRVAGPVAVVPDDDPVRVQEVLAPRSPPSETQGRTRTRAPPCPARRSTRRSEAPVPHGTVDFITSAWRVRLRGGIASTTACTADRSASPEYVGGVPTATNKSRACSSAALRSVEKCRRFAVASQQILEARLIDRRLAALQTLDLVRDRCQRTTRRCPARRNRPPRPIRHSRCRSLRLARGPCS